MSMCCVWQLFSNVVGTDSAAWVQDFFFGSIWEVCIIMDDMNAKIEEGEDLESGLGRYGLGTRNERGERLANFCEANNMMITNTLFQQPSRRRYTWKITFWWTKLGGQQSQMLIQDLELMMTQTTFY